MTDLSEADTKTNWGESYSDPIFDTSNIKIYNETKCTQYSKFYFC